MIIGQFCDSFPPTLDGVARVTFSYCETLTKLGHEAYYIAPKNSDAPEYPGLNTILSPGLKIPTESWHVGLPLVGSKYRRDLKEIPFDIVHAQSPFIAGLEAARIAKKLNIPLVSTFHSKYYDDFLQRTHSKQLSRFLLKFIVDFYDKCDAVWAVNEGTADVLRSYGFEGEITVMENGTDREELDEAAAAKIRRKIHYNENIPTLLFVGRHNKQKNISAIIDACKILKTKGVKFKLVTAGDGPDFDKLVRRARRAGLWGGEAQFLGHVSDRKTLMALYATADLLVFPSLYDSAPMVLREAAVMGTAGLLVKGSCSAENLKDGVNAFIADDETPEKIAEKIIEALPNLKKVGLNAWRDIPISWEEIMKKVVREYERLIEAKKA
ncbi:glycosyltransferase [Candidatus Saccharibacteria bacterium]|nr:glycosyltransferase [Candidatus Saccharibacteria bacterium]